MGASESRGGLCDTSNEEHRDRSATMNVHFTANIKRPMMESTHDYSNHTKIVKVVACDHQQWNEIQFIRLVVEAPLTGDKLLVTIPREKYLDFRSQQVPWQEFTNTKTCIAEDLLEDMNIFDSKDIQSKPSKLTNKEMEHLVHVMWETHLEKISVAARTSKCSEYFVEVAKKYIKELIRSDFRVLYETKRLGLELSKKTRRMSDRLSKYLLDDTLNPEVAKVTRGCMMHTDSRIELEARLKTPKFADSFLLDTEKLCDPVQFKEYFFDKPTNYTRRLEEYFMWDQLDQHEAFDRETWMKQKQMELEHEFRTLGNLAPKLLLTQTGGPPKTLHERAQQVYASKFTPYGQNHAALLVGFFRVEWGKDALIIPKPVLSENAKAVLPLGSTNPDQKDALLLELATMICEWNTKWSYKELARDPEKKQGDCHFFVDEAMKILCKKPPVWVTNPQGIYARFLRTVRTAQTNNAKFKVPLPDGNYKEVDPLDMVSFAAGDFSQYERSPNWEEFCQFLASFRKLRSLQEVAGGRSPMSEALTNHPSAIDGQWTPVDLATNHMAHPGLSASHG